MLVFISVYYTQSWDHFDMQHACQNEPTVLFKLFIYSTKP